MTTWQGWAADFLAAASLPNTANNRRFLNEWAANATHPNCLNNPIDLTRNEPGSKDCGATGQMGVFVQSYTDHVWARTAFNSEIHAAKNSHILSALKAGNPYAVKNRGLMASELGDWGSIDFANVFLNETQAGPPAGLKAPRGLNGWQDNQRSFDVHLPAALKASSKNTRAALQSLARARKVRF
jgi:hypothetical protein